MVATGEACLPNKHSFLFPGMDWYVPSRHERVCRPQSISAERCPDALQNTSINDNCTSNTFLIVLFLLVFQLKKSQRQMQQLLQLLETKPFQYIYILKKFRSYQPSTRSPTVTTRSENTEFKGILKGPALGRGYLSPCIQTLCLCRTQVNCTLQITIKNST